MPVGITRRAVAVAAVSAAVAALSAGCGSSSSSPASSGSASAAAGGSTSAASSAAKGGAPLKVAFVYAGAPDDNGWDTSWQNAVNAAQAKFGNKVSITYKANVPDGPQDLVVFNQLVNAGYKVIFATSFGQQQAALTVAKAHPDVKILQVESAKTLPNLATFDYFGSDGFYVAGMATAAATHSNTLGFVAAFPIPTSLAQINAFELGAQKVNPAAQTRVVWTNDWYDLSKSQKAAQALVTSGAKGLAYLTTGSAIAQVAQSTNTAWNGLEVDQRKFAPKQYVTATILNWAPYVTSQLGDILGGTWKTGSYLTTMQNNGILVAPFGQAYAPASATDKSKIDTTISNLKSGKQYPFTGPIVNQSGKTIVQAGAKQSPADVYTTDYLVKGVVGTIPAAK